MKVQTEKIFIELQNNTSNPQVLNLLDSSNPTSNGLFSPTSNRVIQYDLTAETFPSGNSLRVDVNYNSVSHPIVFTNTFAAGALNITTLLTYLNSLGLGVFTITSGNIFTTVPNYPLVSDNGGQVGVEVSVVLLGPPVMTFEIDETKVVFTGSGTASLNDVNTPADSVTLTITPAGLVQNTGVLVNLGNKNISASGTAATPYTIYTYKNGLPLYSSSGGAGAFTYTSPNFVVAAGDRIQFTITD